MSEQGIFSSEASRFSHSLDAFHYNYVNAAGNRDMIKIEINYSLRTHVFSSEDRLVVTDAFGEPIKVKERFAAMEILRQNQCSDKQSCCKGICMTFCNMADMKLFSDAENMFRKCIIFYATISANKVNKILIHLL